MPVYRSNSNNNDIVKSERVVASLSNSLSPRACLLSDVQRPNAAIDYSLPKACLHKHTRITVVPTRVHTRTSTRTHAHIRVHTRTRAHAHTRTHVVRL